MSGAPDEVCNYRRVQEIYAGKGIPPVTERSAVFHEGPAHALLTDLDYRKKILWL